MKRTRLGNILNGNATVWDYGAYRGGDDGVDDTVKLMRDYIAKDITNPDVIRIAKSINYPIIRCNTDVCNKEQELLRVKSIFRYVVDSVIYNDDGNHEFVQSPRHLLQTKLGDCDDMTTLLACLLYILGFQKIYAKVIAWKKENIDKGNPFTHVYNLVYLPENDIVIPLDAVMGYDGFAMEKTPQIRNKIYQFIV